MREAKKEEEKSFSVPNAPPKIQEETALHQALLRKTSVPAINGDD